MSRSAFRTLLVAFASLVPGLAGAAVPERVWGTYVGAAANDKADVIEEC